jgi:large subunit ribosomal protein L18
MITQTSKNDSRQKIHSRIRRRMLGTAERPRLNVYRSLSHIYAQLINDLDGVTVVSANTLEGVPKGERRTGGNLAAAKEVGRKLAERAKEKGVTQVVFDRGGYLYHGRIKALADAARQAGLKF